MHDASHPDCDATQLPPTVPDTDSTTQNPSEVREASIQLAIKEMLESGWKEKANGLTNQSISAAALKHNVPRSTLSDRWNGKRTRRQAHTSQQHLTYDEERILVAWAKALGRRGVPLTNESLAARACSIAGCELGKNWIYRFRHRHTDIAARWTVGLESSCAQALNKTLVREFL